MVLKSRAISSHPIKPNVNVAGIRLGMIEINPALNEPKTNNKVIVMTIIANPKLFTVDQAI